MNKYKQTEKWITWICAAMKRVAIAFILYLGLTSPLQGLNESLYCRNMLDRENVDPQCSVSSVQAMLVNKEQPFSPWASLFTGATSRPAKVYIFTSNLVFLSITIF